jgi:transaldolase
MTNEKVKSSDMLSNLSVKIFADGADLKGIIDLSKNNLISGFTTNPTLMRKSGVENYVEFAKQVLAAVPSMPVSFEVFADELGEMAEQAIEIASWSENVNVKIPVMNTQGEMTLPILSSLSEKGVKLNVTALMTVDQVKQVVNCLNPDVPSIISVFAGRVADTGVDPIPVMKKCLDLIKENSNAAELLWASPRELFNIFEADRIGCDIITVSHDTLRKLRSVGKDLNQFSLETVKMFHSDAMSAGYRI